MQTEKSAVGQHAWYCMRFNFRGVYISRICNFCVFRVFKFAVAGCSGVEIFADIGNESVYHNSIRQLQRCKTCCTRCWIRLKMSSYRMESCIRGFHIYKEVWTPFIGKRLGCACEKSNRENPFAVAIKRGTETVGHVSRTIWSASVRSSCGSVGSYPVKLQGAADQASTYRHFSYAWHHRLAWAVYVSVYSDVQMFADKIFVDGCWSAKTVNIKPRENLSAYSTKPPASLRGDEDPWVCKPYHNLADHWSRRPCTFPSETQRNSWTESRVLTLSAVERISLERTIKKYRTEWRVRSRWCHLLTYAIYDVTWQYLHSLANQCNCTYFWVCSLSVLFQCILWWRPSIVIDMSVMMNVSKFVGIWETNYIAYLQRETCLSWIKVAMEKSIKRVDCAKTCVQEWVFPWSILPISSTASVMSPYNSLLVKRGTELLWDKE